MASLLKFCDLHGGEQLLPAVMFPADVDVVIDNPREFDGGIPICANVTAMSCSAGVMRGYFDADEVDQVSRMGDVVLNDSTKNGSVNGGGGIGFGGNVLVVGSETSLHPTLDVDSWRHRHVHLDQPLVFKCDGSPINQFFGQRFIVLGVTVSLLALTIGLL